MTEAREAELRHHIRTLASLEEAQGFRQMLTKQGEMTGLVMVALQARMDELAKKEGRR